MTYNKTNGQQPKKMNQGRTRVTGEFAKRMRGEQNTLVKQAFKKLEPKQAKNNGLYLTVEEMTSIMKAKHPVYVIRHTIQSLSDTFFINADGKREVETPDYIKCDEIKDLIDNMDKRKVN